MSDKRREMGMPGVEFEGPMGMFWSIEEVPFEALIEGTCEILEELFRREYKEDFILERIKAKMQERSKAPSIP